MPSFRRRQRGEPRSRRGERFDPPTTEEILLDLRDPLPPGQLEWGMPTLCPRCEEWGYLDRLDVERRVMQLHCPTCRAHWEISEEQIDAANAARREDDADRRVDSDLDADADAEADRSAGGTTGAPVDAEVDAEGAEIEASGPPAA